MSPPTKKTERVAKGFQPLIFSLPERRPQTLLTLLVEDNAARLTLEENPIIIFWTKDSVSQITSRDPPDCLLAPQLQASLSQPFIS